VSDFRHIPVSVTATRSLTSGSGNEAHRHDDHQILYASRGVLSVTTEAGVWITPANRAIWVPAGTWHYHRAYGPTALHLVGLPASVNPLHTSHPTVIAVGPLLRELVIAYTAEDTVPAGPARDRLRAVLLDQLRASAQQPLHVPAPHDARLADVARLLDAEPANNDNLERLATRVGSSARTLSRLCREELGMSIPQWRTQVRLHRALILLAEEAPVTEVAYQCGWSSPSAFIDTFRRALGYTPGRGKTA
jgi:AraC-like DNA-binding protein